MRQGAELESQLLVPAISEAGQARVKARWPATRQNYRHGKQSSVEMGALRFYADGRRGRTYGLRSNHQNPKWADDVRQMEGSPSRTKTALLLDYLPQLR